MYTAGGAQPHQIDGKTIIIVTSQKAGVAKLNMAKARRRLSAGGIHQVKKSGEN